MLSGLQACLFLPGLSPQGVAVAVHIFACVRAVDAAWDSCVHQHTYTLELGQSWKVRLQKQLQFCDAGLGGACGKGSGRFLPAAASGCLDLATSLSTLVLQEGGHL